MSNPIHEINLEVAKQKFSATQHAFQLTERLTYFVVSAELVVCGYMLLNAEKLAALHSAAYLFSACGIAAIMGIVWRYLYNMGYHDAATGHPVSKALLNLQASFYIPFTFLSVAVFIWILVDGYEYIESAQTAIHSSSSSM